MSVGRHHDCVTSPRARVHRRLRFHKCRAMPKVPSSAGLEGVHCAMGGHLPHSTATPALPAGCTAQASQRPRAHALAQVAGPSQGWRQAWRCAPVAAAQASLQSSVAAPPLLSAILAVRASPQPPTVVDPGAASAAVAQASLKSPAVAPPLLSAFPAARASLKSPAAEDPGTALATALRGCAVSRTIGRRASGHPRSKLDEEGRSPREAPCPTHQGCNSREPIWRHVVAAPRVLCQQDLASSHEPNDEEVARQLAAFVQEPARAPGGNTRPPSWADKDWEGKARPEPPTQWAQPLPPSTLLAAQWQRAKGPHPKVEAKCSGRASGGRLPEGGGSSRKPQSTIQRGEALPR